jgi:DNA replication regulator DPB11
MLMPSAAPGSPLAGAFICCTSIDTDTRDYIHKAASDMGAKCSFDLTLKATHLIIGATDSLKYNWVAKERPDMKVVFPRFIEALREIWMKGEEPNVKSLEEEYKVPALHGQRICITGFGSGKKVGLSDGRKANIC